MEKTPAQIIAELVDARETQQVLINRGAAPQTLVLQERRVNALRRALAKANAVAMAAASTVSALASELGMEAWEVLTSLPTGYGETTRLSDRERAALRTAYGK